MTGPGGDDLDSPDMDPVDLEPDARDTDDGPSTVEQRWAYEGIRTLHGKKTHALIDESGTGATRFYHPVRAGLVIGEIYRVTVSRRGEHTILHGDPRYAGDGRVEAQVAAQWRAQDIAARSSLALVRQHREAARRDQLRDALDPLLDIAATLRTRDDRTAFAAYVLTEITNAWTRRAINPRT